MKTNLVNLVLGLAFTAGTVSCQSQKNNLVFEHQGDTVTIVHIAHSAKYLLLPIQEGSKEGQVKLETGSPADTEMDIRLAIDSVEYYVPFALTQDEGGATVTIRNVAADALCWDSIKVSDTFDTTNRDKFRPLYHHTPLYGWMNDANGLVYKDGEYHLYFQITAQATVRIQLLLFILRTVMYPVDRVRCKVWHTARTMDALIQNMNKIRSLLRLTGYRISVIRKYSGMSPNRSGL